MLKIYQGRENVDKEKFIYEHTEGETLVIVPNQYTLVAEEQALKYLNTSCLLNVEILSMNRLGLRMLQEQGTDNVRMLDRYERYMLLARIIRNREKQLDIFRTAAGKRNFVDMVHDFIADFLRQVAGETVDADAYDDFLNSSALKITLGFRQNARKFPAVKINIVDPFDFRMQTRDIFDCAACRDGGKRCDEERFVQVKIRFKSNAHVNTFFRRRIKTPAEPAASCSLL